MNGLLEDPSEVFGQGVGEGTGDLVSGAQVDIVEEWRKDAQVKSYEVVGDLVVLPFRTSDLDYRNGRTAILSLSPRSRLQLGTVRERMYSASA